MILENIITDRHCENCPCFWEEHINTEICNEYDYGCYMISDLESYKWFCIAPKFIRKLIVEHMKKKEIKYWTKIANQMIDKNLEG